MQTIGSNKGTHRKDNVSWTQPYPLGSSTSIIELRQLTRRVRDPEYIRRSQSTGTSDDIHQLVCNSSLATTVVLELQAADHVTGVLGCVVHSVSTGDDVVRCMKFQAEESAYRALISQA